MKNCFVIMPFDHLYYDLYCKAILPAVESELGPKTCRRADREKQLGIITDKIVHGILNSDLVVAVVTGANPNVMYELGVAHSMRKPTVLLVGGSDSPQLPFDIAAHEVVYYEFDPGSSVAEQQAQLRTIKIQVSEYLSAFNSRRQLITNPIAKALQGKRLFVDDLRDWLWGYSDVYEREKGATVIWEMTPNPHWVTRDPLFNEQIRASILAERKKFFYLVPRTDAVLAEMSNFIRSLQESLGEGHQEKIRRQLKYISIDPDFFELIPFSIVIYDAVYATRADAVICEPMAPEIGEDAEYDGYLIGMGPQDWGSLSKIDRMNERFFDIRLAEQKLRKLTWTFTAKWNEQLEHEIAGAREERERHFLRDHWKI